MFPARAKSIFLTLAIVAVLISALVLWWSYWRAHRYDSEVRAAALRYQIAPGLIKALIWRESRFDADARGKAGELGLMQIRSEAAQEWADHERLRGFQHEHCLDSATNIMAGTFYLQKALSKYRSADDPLPYALAEYNAGRRNVLRWSEGVARTNSRVFITAIGFPSTSNYVREILAKMREHEADFD